MNARRALSIACALCVTASMACGDDPTTSAPAGAGAPRKNRKDADSAETPKAEQRPVTANPSATTQPVSNVIPSTRTVVSAAEPGITVTDEVTNHAAAQPAGPVRRAWVGPSIRSCCYEVGPEVIDAFTAAGLPVADDRHVDIPEAAAAALRALGVHDIAVSEVCTGCDPSWFSHRREGTTGRNGAFAALRRR